MPLTYAHAARIAVAIAVAVALLTCVPSPAAAVTDPAEVRAVKTALLAAIEPCSDRVPRGDVEAVGRCAQDLAVPDADQRYDVIGLIKAFVYCLWLQWPYDKDSLYPSVGSCMGAQGY